MRRLLLWSAGLAWLVMLLALVASLAHAKYNRAAGVVDVPDGAFVTGQVMRAIDADNAAIAVGGDNTLLLSNGSTYLDAVVPQCTPFATPPTFLLYSQATHAFTCAGYGISNGSAGYVQRSNGAGGFVGSSGLQFDGTTNTLMLGDTTLPGTLNFAINASSPGPVQITGRGGGQFWRMYPNRSHTLSGESFFFGIDSQADSTTDALSISKNNADPLLGTLLFRFGEDGTVRLYDTSNDGFYLSLQAPATAAATQTYTLPNAVPAVTRYCLGSTTAGVWSWVDCALLGGRSGGQILLGGTASSESLSLGSNAADSTTGAVNVISPLILRPGTVSVGNALVSWSGTVNIPSNLQFFQAFTATGTLNLNVMPFLGLGSVLFGTQMPVNFNQTGSYTGAPIFYAHDTYTAATGTTTTFDTLSSGNGNAEFMDYPVMARAGTGAYDGTSGYDGFRSRFSVSTGVTFPNAVAFHVQDGDGAGTLSGRKGLLVDNLTKCTAPNCTGISNSSTTDFASATQNIGAAGTAITGCASRTMVGITNSTAAKITLTSTPTIADGRDGQICRIMNVETTAGAGAQIAIQDEVALAGSNLRVSAAGACSLCAIGVCTLDARDFVEFTYSTAAGDWIMTGCQDN